VAPAGIAATITLSGTIFEDINFGGGAGRSLATANAVLAGSAVGVGTAGTPATAATVELYDASGSFVATTQTSTTAGALGQYSFSVASATTYTVRVVNATVRSTRTGTTAGLLPVQTYNGTTTKVGGQAPEKTDAAANTSATLASLSTGTGLTGLTPQSIVTLTTDASNATGVDFGFNFDLVVNTRTAGQGSLRQFIVNANALGDEAGLVQAGANAAGTLPAATETSIFMIPDGNARAGQLAGLATGLNLSGVAVITPTTVLPAISGPTTYVDGSTQTFNINNSNNLTLGVGGTVGTTPTALSTVNGPEVQLVGSSAMATGLDIASTGTGTNVIGLAIYGFGTNGNNDNSGEIRVAAGGVTISRNVLGTAATAFTDLGTGVRGLADAIRFTAVTTASTVSNNLIGYNGGKGIGVNSTSRNVSVTNNEVRSNAKTDANWDGLDFEGSSNSATFNLFVDNAGQGVDTYNSTGSNTITDNTVSGNGRGIAAGPGETPGIRIYGNLNTVSRNIVNGNYGAGILVNNTSATTVISQNAIFNNGTVLAVSGAAATGQIGIDLNNGATSTGVAPFVTTNDLNDSDGGANGLLNFPVIQTAYFSGSNLVVTGYARPGSLVEFFVPAADASGFGEGQTFIAALTEGAAGVDTNAGTGTYTNPVNGLNQGTDNTNLFTFSIPLTSAQQAAILANGLTSTATLSGATSEFGGNTALVTIKGTVFEDQNYGGGSGRSIATANGVTAGSAVGVGTAGNPATAATVELYDASGNFVASTTTSTTAGSLGQYTFSAAPGSYSVRVVSSTVRSARPGAVAGLLPVQTFRTNAGAADVSRVGGEAPEKADAGTTVGQILSFTGKSLTSDNTAFVDLVEILDASSNVVAGLPLNPSFETPSLGTAAYQYNPTGTSWSFNSFSGIAANGSAFNVGGTNPVAPDGTQVALVQSVSSGTGSFSQALALSPGTYTVRFRAAQRTTNAQSLTVAINGTSLGTFTPASSAYTTYTTASFTVSSTVTLSGLTTSTTAPQSLAPLTLTSAGATGIDFGFNFSTVVNTNDSGQGSLRQFTINTNALTNAGLDQAASSNGGIDPAAGKEYSIFMITDGAAHAGLRSGLTNQLTGASGSARAVITMPGTALLQLTDGSTVVDGTSQTLNVGDTNTGTLGNVSTVGTDAIAFTANDKPEVEIAGNSVSTVLFLNGPNQTLQGLAIRGGTTQTIAISVAASFLLQNNVIGSGATAFTWAGDGTVSGNYGISVAGGSNGSILDNLIGFTGNSGLNVNNGTGSSLITVQDNEFTQNGYTSSGGDGISLGDGGGAGPLLIQQNLFTRSNSSAVQFEIGATSSTTVTNNTIISAGKGGAGFALSQLEGSAICYLSRTGGNRTRAGVIDLINKNIIVDTQASGIVIGYGSQNTVISQNSIYNSGSVAIDHNTSPNAHVGGAGSGAVEYGSGDGVTINDGNDPATAPATLANKGLDYPVLTTIDLVGTTLTVSGYSRPGAVIELFIPELDPTRFGEGRTYLATRTEGSGADTDGGTGSYGPGAINGVAQGQDAAANRFRFTISTAALTSTQLTAILNTGVTSTATLNNSTSEFSPNVPFSADVLATITAPASTIAAGQTATFNVTFNNIGGSSANGVVATVQLPAGLTGVIVSGSGSYSTTTGLVSYAGITVLSPATPVTSTITYTQPVNGAAVTGVAAVSTSTNQNGLTANDSQSATILAGPAFDLLTTLGGPASTVAGQLTTYAVTTQNSGPGAAPGAVQTVSFATVAALSDVFASNGGTYSYSGGLSMFTFPVPVSLPVGEVVNNSFSFTAPTSGPLSLMALVTPNTTGAGDVNTSNNTATLSTTVSAAPATQANVYTTISSNATNGSAAPGAAVTYTVVQGNNGPSTATGVVPQVALSPNLTAAGFTVNGAAGSLSGTTISFTITGGTATYSQSTGILTLPTLGTQASSSSQAYTVVAPAPTSGVLTVTASVSATTADPVPADNEAATEVTVTNALTADLATSIVGPATASTGQVITYTVTTANNGPGIAQNVVQTVNIPAGLAITGVNAVLLNGAAPTSTSGNTATYAGGATYNASTGVVRIPNPTGVTGPGTAATNSISYAAPVNNGSLTNIAVVSATSPDGVPANNTASIATTVQTLADVAVYISGPTSSTIGSPVTYVVTTTNNGASVSSSETTTVQLPSGLSGVEVRGYDGLVITGAYNSTSGVVTFPAITNQSVGGAGAVRGSVTFLTPSTTVFTPSATATVSSNNDPNLGNNNASVSVGVVPATTAQPDLSTAFVATTATTATAGASITLTVQSSNAAGSPATTSVVQDVALAAGLTTTGFTVGGSAGTLNVGTGLLEFAVAGGTATYSPITGVLSIPISSLAAGASVNTAIVQPAPGVGPYAVTTTIRGNDSDPTPNNNRATNVVAITPSVDVTTNVIGPTLAAIGATVSYSVVTTNNGPSPASNVVQTVTLPAGATGVVVSGGGTVAGSLVTFPTINNQAVGAVGTVTNTVTLTVPNTTPSITVTGNVTATGDVTVGGNNTSSQITTTQPNSPPVAADVVNALQTPEGSTAVTQLPISPLQATDADGNATIITYTITSIPTAGTQGTLYYNSSGSTYTAVAAGQALTATQATTLRFTPAAGYVGNVFFNYTATDNGNGTPANMLSSNTARYTIQVGQDNPALYTLTPVKGGTANPYANTDILALVADPNGAQYTSAGLITYNATTGAVATGDNGTRTVVLTTGPLPAGTTLNPVTGLITVTDRTLLVAGSYPLTITTTDVFGGVTVHNITLVIGGSPIAVDDEATTPPNTAVTFAVAANDLANDGAAINPATIDLDPNTAGIQPSITTAQGTFTTVGAPSGSVLFTPTSPTFTGTASTPYVISNSATPTAAISNQANLIVIVRNQPYDLATSITSPSTGSAVNAGQSLTFTVLAQNNGPVAAANAAQTLQLPAGLGTVTFGTPTVGAGATITGAASYNNTTGLVTFPTISTQASGATGNVTFTATITVPGSGPFAGVATVQASGNVDPTPANNTATVSLNVTPQFDLLTTLTGPASVVTGDLATYVVTSRNAGPSAVSNAVQTVQLPTSLTGVFVTNGGSYNSSTGVVTFPSVALASDQAVNNTISFAPTATFSPSATITPNTNATGDPVTGNNLAYLNGAGILTAVTVTSATTNQANVYVTVSGPAAVSPGTTATYIVTQGNNGPNPAASVLTSVSLSSGLSTATLTLSGTTGTSVAGNVITFTGGVNNGASYDTQTGILTLPTLSTQASAATPQSYTIGVTAPNAGPALTVTANVVTATSDPVPGDNVATVQTEIMPLVDVAISISGPASMGAGQVATYSVRTLNSSATPAQGVVQTVAIPAGLTAAGLQVNGTTGTLSGSTITFAGGATYDASTGTLTLPTITTLLGGATQATTISYPAPAAATLYNVAAVRSTTPDGVLTNNAASSITTISPVQDVVVLVSGPAQAVAGNPVSYTITTTNNGPSTTGMQTTTVQLATGLTGVEVRDAAGALVSGAYNATTGLVTFASATVPQPGQSTVGTVRFIAPEVVQLSVAAAAATSATDANLDNNTARVSTPVILTNLGNADIQTAISAAPTGTQAVGTTVTYTVTTTNNGPSTAQNVVRTVSLPANLDPTTLQVATVLGTLSGGVVTFPNGSTYTVATGVLTLPTLATLNNAASSAIAISFPLPGRDETSYTLGIVANSVANNSDPTLTNNTAASNALTVTPRADVSAAISGPSTALPGQPVTYTMSTTNNGPSAAPGVAQTFVLPTGVTSYTLNGVTTAGSGTITIAVGTLLNGGTVANVIGFTAPTTSFSVSGTASTTATDPVAGNNTATTPTTSSNLAPVAYDVVNTLQSPEGNTAAAPLPISPLAGSDSDGTVASYQLLSIPATTQGVLYYNSAGTYTAIATANIVGGGSPLSLTPTQAATLRFDPASTFAGTVSFTYQDTDNLGALSNAGRYTIQSGIDNASLYANTPVKTNTNTNPYVTNDVLAFVIDPNGAAYNSAALVYSTATGALQSGTSNGLAAAGTNAVLAPAGSGPVSNPTNVLPAGVSLNPSTGQIYVSNASLLPAITTNTAYSVSITTTDVYGGVTTQTVTFTLGAYPLPVELTVFTAQAVRNVDGLLQWTTASEKNNDHFDVERSANGRDFVKIGEVQGQGRKASPTDYRLTDTNAAKLGALLYYRLKQVDTDGTSSYSPVRTLAFTKPITPAISLYPNPALGATSLDLSQLPAGSYQLRLLDATGRTVLGATLEGGLTHQLTLADVADGTYSVLVQGRSQAGQAILLITRLVKQ
jgi:uncharacterized repeat protein (TIGR01451 family)